MIAALLVAVRVLDLDTKLRVEVQCIVTIHSLMASGVSQSLRADLEVMCSVCDSAATHCGTLQHYTATVYCRMVQCSAVCCSRVSVMCCVRA